MGVQTCALPICSTSATRRSAASSRLRRTSLAGKPCQPPQSCLHLADWTERDVDDAVYDYVEYPTSYFEVGPGFAGDSCGWDSSTLLSRVCRDTAPDAATAGPRCRNTRQTVVAHFAVDP